jgi:hypothetical protein
MKTVSIRERYLQVKVWFVQLLQRCRILPKIWYACEIELAEIKAKRMAEFFNSRKG